MSKNYHKEEGFKPFEQFGPLFEKLKVRLAIREELSQIARSRQSASLNEKKRQEQKLS